MKQSGIRGITLTALLAALALSGCGGGEPVEQVERQISVKAMTVTANDREVVSSYTGTLEGEQQAVVYAKLAEAVEDVQVREGQTVNAREVLVSLDRTGPSSKYSEVRSYYLNAEKNFRKMEYLYQQGAVSETEFDAASTDYEVAQANFEAVKRLVDVETPIAGTVTEVAITEGDFVNVGTHLATVATTDRLRVRFDVDPDAVGFFRLDNPVNIRVEGVGAPGRGTVVSIARSADPQTRTFQVEALVDNSDGRFKPGMFAHIDYILQRLDSVITVPRDAVITLDERPTAFIVKGDMARVRPLSLGRELPGEVVVTGGLSAGDTLIVLGQDFLEDSTKVNITDMREPLL
jgi:membrane fusion protein (multidrug efflux system)